MSRFRFLTVSIFAAALVFATNIPVVRATGARCGEVEGLALFYNPDNSGLFNPHDIADFAIEHHLIPNSYDRGTMRAWLHLRPDLPSLHRANVATIQSHYPGLATETAENLEDLVRIHEAIVLMEGASLTPQIVAAFDSQNWKSDWRNKYMSREQYHSEYKRIAEEFTSQGYHPGLATTLTYMVLLNWFDREHTGRDMSQFNNTRSWDDVSRNDVRLRFQIMKESIGELPDWVISRLNRYAARRNTTLECLAYEQSRWQNLAVPELAGIKVRAFKTRDGWCAEKVALRIEIANMQDFERIGDIADGAAATAAGKCPSLTDISLSAWTDGGAARVYGAEAMQDGGWRWTETTDPAERATVTAQIVAAEQGDTKAMLRLAHRYEFGVGLERNLQAAYAWMEKAAESGNGFAAAELARMLSDGIGTWRDLEAASRWAHHAAEKGDPAGLFWRAMIDWPFNSLERFLESYKSGEFITDMIVQPTLDLARAVALCDTSPYASDPDYQQACVLIKETDERMRTAGKRLAGNPLRQVKSYSDTVGDHMFDMRDPIQLWGATMMMNIR